MVVLLLIQMYGASRSSFSALDQAAKTISRPNKLHRGQSIKQKGQPPIANQSEFEELEERVILTFSRGSDKTNDVLF
jgi:hypothetical protein